MIKFTIDGRLNSMNEFINACCRSPYEKNAMKKRTQLMVISYIKKDIPEFKTDKPIKIRYLFVEKKFRRDLDNIASYAMKTVQDSLVTYGTIPDDKFKYIKGFSCEFEEGEENRIEVELVEVV